MNRVVGGVLLAGAFVYDAAAHALRESAIQALEVSGWKHDAAAKVMGITPSRLSLQLNGHEPLAFLGRAAKLDGFYPALFKIHGKKLGCELIDNAELQRLLSGLASLEKRMARMGLPDGQTERKQA